MIIIVGVVVMFIVVIAFFAITWKQIKKDIEDEENTYH